MYTTGPISTRGLNIPPSTIEFLIKVHEDCGLNFSFDQRCPRNSYVEGTLGLVGVEWSKMSSSSRGALQRSVANMLGVPARYVSTKGVASGAATTRSALQASTAPATPASSSNSSITAAVPTRVIERILFNVSVPMGEDAAMASKTFSVLSRSGGADVSEATASYLTDNPSVAPEVVYVDPQFSGTADDLVAGGTPSPSATSGSTKSLSLSRTALIAILAVVGSAILLMACAIVLVCAKRRKARQHEAKEDEERRARAEREGTEVAPVRAAARPSGTMRSTATPPTAGSGRPSGRPASPPHARDPRVPSVAGSEVASVTSATSGARVKSMLVHENKIYELDLDEMSLEKPQRKTTNNKFEFSGNSLSASVSFSDDGYDSR